MIDIMSQDGLEQVDGIGCPNVLIRSGNEIHLLNTNLQRGPSNPLVFQNLDQYLEFLNSQREEGMRCPVLFLQEENNTQGQNVFRVRPSPMNMNAGVPTEAAQLMPDVGQQMPDNNNNNNNGAGWSGIDAHGQNIGKYTVLDSIHDSTKRAINSDNPMDSNWGGVSWSQKALESGKYVGNEVSKQQFVPKVIEIYK